MIIWPYVWMSDGHAARFQGDGYLVAIAGATLSCGSGQRAQSVSLRARKGCPADEVLVVYAHPYRGSFCHAVLERVVSGLDEAGHSHEVIDLHRSRFDPVFRNRDYNQFMHESLPDDLIAQANLKPALVARAGGPVRRAVARRWMAGKTDREIVRALGRRTPRDVRKQQEKVARAEGLIFIAPVYWMGLPAILKGWFERVFAYGFAYTLDREGWNGQPQGGFRCSPSRRAWSSHRRSSPRTSTRRAGSRRWTPSSVTGA